MKKRQGGFSAVEILLAVVVVTLLGLVGWHVYKTKNNAVNREASVGSSQSVAEKQDKASDRKATLKDETKEWIPFVASSGWTMKIPDGWVLYTDSGSTGLTSFSTLEYRPGTRAVIEETSSGRGGPFGFSASSYAAGDPATQNPDYLQEESVFKAVNVEGRKYSGTLKEDMPMEGSKGDIIYRYVFVKDTRSVIFQHYQAKDTQSILTEVERSIRTLEFK